MRRPTTQTRLALAVLGVATAATIAAVIGAGWWARDRALHAGDEALRHSVLTLERSVDRAIGSLRDLTTGLRYDLAQDQASPPASGVTYIEQVAAVDHLVLLDLVDQAGQILASSEPRRIGQTATGFHAAATPDIAATQHLTITRVQLDAAPGGADPPARLIALTIAAGERSAILYLRPAFFAAAINSATTWKNHEADLITAAGTPVLGEPAAWHPPVDGDMAAGAETPLERLIPATTNLRTDQWLVAHRWLPDLGVRVATAVPKSAVLAGWLTDLGIAIGVGFAVLLSIGLLTVMTLRTERRRDQAEAELQAMTERLNLAFEGSNDGVWDWNTITDHAYYSSRWRTLLGYHDDEVAPRPQSWMDLLHPDDKPAVCAAMQHHLDGATEVYFAAHRMRRRSGDWLWVETRGKALRATDGKAYRMVGTMTDIEEKKRQELAVLAARDEAEAANRAKSEFLAVVSHEVRTPMSGVLGMAQVLLATALTTKQRRYAELIKSSGDNLLAILNDILDFSKLEAGHLSLESIDFQLDDEIDSVIKLMEPQARSKGIALHFDNRIGRRIALNGDPNRIRQILINLIGNAIKFTNAGSVALRCGVKTLAAGQFEVKFEVVDTGIGMSDDVRRGLFRKFSQGDPSIARRFGGTGLGLAISHQLATLMGGNISVESQPDVGSRFAVTLNLGKATAVPRRRTESLAAATRPDIAALRILAAEDSLVNQILLRELISPHVAELVIVASGEAVIEAAANDDYDLILMDVRLPGIDGVAATQAIRQLDARWRTRPIIALTANAMADQHESYLDAGMTACLTKPIDTDKLFATLSEIAASLPAAKPSPRDTARPARSHDEATATADKDPGAAPDTAPTVDQPDANPLMAADGVDQLTAIIGPESVASLLAQLAKQLRDSMRQIEGADDQPEAISALAHTLAGASGNCQAMRVSKMARAVEAAITSGDGLAPALDDLRDAVAHTLPAIDETITRLTASVPEAPGRRAVAR